MSEFISFASMSRDRQERVILASRPAIHLEPLVLQDGGSRASMPAVHFQIGDSHAVLNCSEVDGFLTALLEAVRKANS